MKGMYVAVISGMISAHAMAQDISITGTISLPLKPLAAQTKHQSELKLMRVHLSDKAMSVLAKRAKEALAGEKQLLVHYGKFPDAVQLGMNNVPVLNQGAHGSCVTFAVTAAIDAELNKGNYISQLCSLQLGNYLAGNGYNTSGWDGAWARNVLNQLSTFGLVNKNSEAEYGCGGLYQYPLESGDPQTTVSPEDYHLLSEPSVSWSTILDAEEAYLDRVDTHKTLAAVKESLMQGNRVAFGVLLLDFDLGFVGAVGKKGNNYDSWVLTPEIARDAYLHPDFGGHEMVITGYDDNAIAVDDEGRKHQGLLTLRNSWGETGDHGDFYMSYDYFQLFVDEAHRIRGFANLE